MAFEVRYNKKNLTMNISPKPVLFLVRFLRSCFPESCIYLPPSLSFYKSQIMLFSHAKSIATFVLVVFMVASCSKSGVEAEILAPRIIVSSSLSPIANQPFSYQVEVSDPQGLKVTVSVEGMPSWMSFDPTDSRISGTPSESDTGISELTITADNGKSSDTKVLPMRVFRSLSEFGLQSQLETLRGQITPGLKGVSMAVVDGSGTLFTAYTGHMGDSPSHPALRTHHMYRVASVTKPMTAALVLQLVDEGVIRLEDRLNTHYQTPLPAAHQMNIRHMLNHTAGIFDHLNASSFWSHPSNNQTKVWTVEEIVQFAVQNGSRFDPGSAYGYSNTGFCVLGALVETKTEMNLADAFKIKLFDPLGLDQILYDDFSGPGNTIPNLAFNSRSYEYHLTAAGASGAIAASPSNVALLGWNLYGGNILSAPLTEDMSVNYGIRVGGQNYGLGTRIWTIGGIRHYGHTGNLMNYRNILMYEPQSNIAIAIHTHEPHTNWFSLVDDLFLYVIDNFPTQPVKRLPSFMFDDETRE